MVAVFQGLPSNSEFCSDCGLQAMRPCVIMSPHPLTSLLEPLPPGSGCTHSGLVIVLLTQGVSASHHCCPTRVQYQHLPSLQCDTKNVPWWQSGPAGEPLPRHFSSGFRPGHSLCGGPLPVPDSACHSDISIKTSFSERVAPSAEQPLS